MEFPIIPCNLCGSQENLQRQKDQGNDAGLGQTLSRDAVKQHFTALQNIVPSHLADNQLFDFRNLTLDTPVEEGDIVFDAPEMPIVGTPTNKPFGITTAWHSTFIIVYSIYLSAKLSNRMSQATLNKTIMFADVSGSARLFERLEDTEAAHAVERCIKRMERSITGLSRSDPASRRR